MTEPADATEPADGTPTLPWGEPRDPEHANVMQVAAGPFDVALVFGQQDLTSRGPNGQPTQTREVARIYMSWGHLKSMIPLLAKMVASYEQQMGEVPSPGFDQMWKE